MEGGTPFKTYWKKIDIVCASIGFLVKMKAYVLLNSELGREYSVIEALQGVNEITNIQTIYGVYDIIIEMETDSIDRLKEIIFNKVRRLEYVKNTISLITYGDPVINE